MLKYITSNLENNKKFDGVQIYKRQLKGKTKRKRSKNLISKIF